MKHLQFMQTNLKEITNMADVTTTDIANILNAESDLRREAVEHTNEIINETLKSGYNDILAIKDARHDIISTTTDARQDLSKQVDAIDDTLTDKFFVLARESADNRAQITALSYQVRDGFLGASKDGEIAALKNQVENARNTSAILEKVGHDGNETRRLIADFKNADLNRMLIERNAEVVEERHHSRHWRGNYDQAQFVALNNQLQAFQSDLQATRQGMVNFGTMAGVGQSSTSNTVR